MLKDTQKNILRCIQGGFLLFEDPKGCPVNEFGMSRVYGFKITAGQFAFPSLL